MNGLVPTMKGNDSSDLTRTARRLGISNRAKFTDSSRDSGVRGRPKESSLERLRGRGGELALYLSSSSVISAEEAAGARL